MRNTRWPRWPRRPAQRPLRVAMIGQKGLPATFGGVEHHVEELGSRLVDQGVDVAVYCRRSYAETVPEEYRGMRLIVTPTVASKHLDAIVHSIISTVHAMLSGADVIHYHALGPGLAAPLSRGLSKAKVVQTIHGLDQDRAKWSRLARRVLGIAYWMSTRVPHAVVTVSRTLAAQYEADAERPAQYIPNGFVPARPGHALGRLQTELGLVPGRYVLFVGRLVPEKRPDLLVQAAQHLPERFQVVLAGDSSFSDAYVDEIKRSAAAAGKVVLPGYVFGDELAALYEHAAAFVQPSDLEGLPLTVLEAMSYGVPVLASDIAPHRELLSGCACDGHRLFRAGSWESLTAELTSLLSLECEELRHVSEDSAVLLQPYDWDRATASLLSLYATVSRRSPVSGTALTARDRRAEAVTANRVEA